MGLNHMIFDIEETLFEVLEASSLKTEISGRIFRTQRPTNRVGLEDVVVNVVSLTQSNHQNGIGNINIHVKDLEVLIDGQNESVPNNARLKELNRIACEAILAARRNQMGLSIAGQATFSEGEEHINNIRVLFNILN